MPRALGSVRAAAGVVAVTMALAAGFVVVPAEPAEALMVEPLVIREGPPSSKTYPGIRGSYAGTAAATWTPSGCGNATNTAPAQATCDRVPLDVVPPDVDPADDWFLIIEVTWRPSESAENDAQDAQLCDLDIFLYDDNQVARRSNPESGTFTRMGSSETAGQPETIKTYAPDLGRYNLVVQNFAGVNIDYTVKGWFVIGKFDPPFEALGPVARESGGADEEAASRPVDLSGDDVRPAAPRGDDGAASFVPITQGVLEEVAVLPEGDFESFGEGSSFENRLRAPSPTGIGGALAAIGPPADVSPAIVIFWLVFVPLALAGAGFFVLLRRRPALL